MAPFLAALATRFGPWLGRVIAANRAKLPVLLEKLRKGGSFVGTNVADITKYVSTAIKSGQATQVMFVLATLASLGFSVSELFKESDGEEAMEVARQLQSAQESGDATSAAAGASASSLNPNCGYDPVARQLFDELAVWCAHHYGTVEGALRAHRLQQKFFSMDYDLLKRELPYVNLGDARRRLNGSKF